MSTTRSQVTKLVWTRGYNPFQMGGDVNAPIGTMLMCLPVSLGRGFKGLVATTPKGNVVVAEFETGAIVGRSVEQVKQDIREGQMKDMLQQIVDAKALLPRVRRMNAEEFWARYPDKDGEDAS